MVDLPRLSSSAPITQDGPGKPGLEPHYNYVEFFNRLIGSIEGELNQINSLIAAISWPYGLTIHGVADGATAKITRSAHTRVSLSTAVAVDGGEVTGLAYATLYYVFYDDPSRAGGAVTYDATTVQLDAFASTDNPYRLFVGSVTTPATSGDPPTDGTPAGPPGDTQPV